MFTEASEIVSRWKHQICVELWQEFICDQCSLSYVNHIFHQFCLLQDIWRSLKLHCFFLAPLRIGFQTCGQSALTAVYLDAPNSKYSPRSRAQALVVYPFVHFREILILSMLLMQVVIAGKAQVEPITATQWYLLHPYMRKLCSTFTL